MPGLVVVSDTHFDNRKQFGKVLTSPLWQGCNSRFHEIAYAFQAAFEYALKNKCEAIVVPGDIFHTRSIIKVPIYNAVYSIFEQVAQQSKVKLILMPGNHDFHDVKAMYGTEGLHSLFAMNAMTIVADKPSHIPLDSFDLYMVPFNPDPEWVVANAKAIFTTRSNTSKPSILFLHHSINGAETGPSNWKMPHELQPQDLALGFDVVISGHYHKHQRLPHDIVYAGGLLQHDFGERDYVPGWLHVTPDGKWAHVENTLSPRFKEIETSNSKEVAALADAKDYWSVIWTGDKGEKAKWEKLEDVSVSFKAAAADAVMRSNISGQDSVPEMVSKYVKAKIGQDDPALVEYALQFFGLSQT